MRCGEYRAALLAGEERPELAMHLEGCEACRAERPRLEEVRSALSDPRTWEEPSDELPVRVSAAVTGTAGPRRRVLSRWWAVAAAVALLAGIGAWWATSRPAPPDWEVMLVGTEAAPQAWGVVQGWETPSGTAVFLRVEGLSTAPPGHYYELWFASDEGIMSAGTFRAAPGFELWAAARLHDYPRLGITLEPDDGDPGRSGVQVLGSRAAP